MKMTDLRAKARAIFGPAIAEPMPKQPNGAKALQERANARPIPTYKVGGAVKKQKPPQPTAADREAERKRREEYAKMKVTPEQGSAITRGNRAAATERPGYKTGGKVQTASDTARKLATEMGGMKKGGKAMKPVDSDKNPGLDKLPKEVRNKMGYMKKGGNAKKDGLAVMIAIGEPKKPVKKMGGGRMHADDSKPVKKMGGGMMSRDMMPADMSSYRMADGGESMMYAKGGMACAKDGGQMKKPIKRAAGGAAKVRKGMMTPEGKITHAMNKVRGK
jgi:hypothetical protein